MKVTKVSGNIYMLEGQGGNIAASVGEDGIVIVDDQFAPLAEKIQAALKELKITDKPVRFVINTHYHGDHTGGNVPFNNAGSTLIAQDNVRKRLESGGTAGNGGSVKFEYKPETKAGLPIITFEHDVTVHLNGEDIRALHFPSGHTDGDSIIFFPKNNVVHMGDDFVRYGFPFIDVASGGSVQGMIDAMEKATAQLPADVKVIPGHGAISNLDDVRAFTKMLKETSAAVQKALNGHKTLEQMKKEKVLAPWKKFSGDFVNEDVFIETLYNSLTGHKGAFVKHGSYEDGIQIRGHVLGGLDAAGGQTIRGYAIAGLCDTAFARLFEPPCALHDEELCEEEANNDENNAPGHAPGLFVGFGLCELHSAPALMRLLPSSPRRSPPGKYFWRLLRDGNLAVISGADRSLQLRPGVRREKSERQIARGAQAGRSVQDGWDRIHHHGCRGDVSMRAAGNRQADVGMPRQRDGIGGIVSAALYLYLHVDKGFYLFLKTPRDLVCPPPPAPPQPQGFALY